MQVDSDGNPIPDERLAETILAPDELMDEFQRAFAYEDLEISSKDEEFELPPEFNSEAEFCQHAVQLFDNDQTADALNIQAMIEDFNFMTGKQWDKTAEARRHANKKPVLTINRLPAFVAQIVGNRLLNQTTVEVLPDRGGTKDVAKLRQGLIRGIEKRSRANDAYDTALTHSLIGGLGNFAIEADYADYDVFEQDLKVRRIADPTAVTWDHLSVEPTGQDARHVFVEERMSRKEFDNKYPDKTPASFGGETQYIQQLTANGWFTHDSVRVVEYWQMREKPRLIILNKMTGETNDVTDIMTEEEAVQYAAPKPGGGLYMRWANRPYAEMYLMTALNILEGPYRLNCSRVPVFRVPGWELMIGDDRHRFGMVRFAKDPQRIHNYWRSVIVEKLMQAPRAKWIASKEAVKGYENMWRRSNMTDDALLIWNGESGERPEEVKPVQIEPALIQEAQAAVQDLRDVLNMHEAAMGMMGNEVSGKALDRRMRISELGSVIYFSNLDKAIEEGGRVMNELIPDFYDTARQVMIVGDDDRAVTALINQDDGISDIGIGKYATTITTGPSYTTKRVEAVESMMALTNAMPQAMAPALDLLVENMDWPGAADIAKRLRATLPPQVIMSNPGEMTQQEQMLAQQMQQKAKLQEQIEMEDLRLTLAQKRAEVMKLESEIAQGNAKIVKDRASAIRDVAEAKKTDAETQELEIRTNLDISRYLDELGNSTEQE